MILFDITGMDVDSYLEDEVEKGEYLFNPCTTYMIMSEDTFRLFELLSKQYDKEHNCWNYQGCEGVPDTFNIAIDKKLNFGEVIVR